VQFVRLILVFACGSNPYKEYAVLWLAVPSSIVQQQFDREGYVLLENFFTDEELGGVVETMQQYFPQTEEKMEAVSKKWGKRFAQFETKTASFGQEAAQEQAFIELGKHPLMHELTTWLVGPHYEDEGLLVKITTKGHGQSWHRDCNSDNPSHFVKNRLIYTTDISAEQGALALVPGSQRAACFSPGGLHEPIEGEVIIAPRKGTLAFVNATVFHRVYRNETDTPRYSINYRVRPSGVPAGLTRVGVYRTGTFNFAKM
jgi:ectoine hydroxylase-related dioxygenase (phytanoyl-CoA dioxygenase family)